MKCSNNPQNISAKHLPSTSSFPTDTGNGYQTTSASEQRGQEILCTIKKTKEICLKWNHGKMPSMK